MSCCSLNSIVSSHLSYAFSYTPVLQLSCIGVSVSVGIAAVIAGVGGGIVVIIVVIVRRDKKKKEVGGSGLNPAVRVHTHNTQHTHTVRTYSTYSYKQICLDFTYDLLTYFSLCLHAFCGYSTVKVLFLPKTVTVSSSNQIPAIVQWKGPISDNTIAACLSGCTYVHTLVTETIQSCIKFFSLYLSCY